MNIKDHSKISGYTEAKNLEQYYTREEVLKLLNFSKMRLYRLRKAKLFPSPIYLKDKNDMLNRPLKAFFLKSDIENWLSKQNPLPKI